MPPFITANFALSADGKISTRGPGGSGFGSPADHRRLLALRAEADAVLVGQSTLVADRMSLGLGSSASEWRERRLARGQAPFPARVVVGAGRPLASDHPVFSAEAGPLHVLLAPGSEAGATGDGIHWHGSGEWVREDWPERLLALARAEGWNHLHCEGGARIFDTLARAGLIDVLYLTIVPVVFGGHAAPRLLPTGAAWEHSTGFRLADFESTGDEIFLRYEKADSREASSSGPA